MIVEENLKRVDDTTPRSYEEPDGEIIEVVSNTKRTVTVLTRQETSSNPPFDPEHYTVSEIEEMLLGGEYTDEQLDAMLQLEHNGKDRATALSAIEDRQ